MRDKLTEIKTLLGYGGSEVFPKQIQLKSADDTGNFLNLPYFGGEDTTRYAFRADGEAATLEEFYTIYSEIKQTDFTKIKIECAPLSDILDENNAPSVIDYLTLDIEGAEEAVITTFEAANSSSLCPVTNTGGSTSLKKSEKRSLCSPAAQATTNCI